MPAVPDRNTAMSASQQQPGAGAVRAPASKVGLYAETSHAALRLSFATTDDDLARAIASHAGERVQRALDAIPRRRYVKQATPIERLDNLSALLGGAEMFVKRDDLLPLAGGGSKTRKLEYLVQAAIDAGADTLVTCGAVQSNHCRLTASAAARERLGCHLILEERVAGSYDPAAGGNNYTFGLLGATTAVVPAGGVPEEEARAMATLRAAGKRPFWIAGGGSTELGSLGYARAALEVVAHAREHGPFDAIVLCSGSGGTHAGMLAGLRAAGDRTPVVGISTRAAAPAQAAKILALARDTVSKLGLGGAGAGAVVGERDVVVLDEFVGPGYSLPTAEMAEAIELFAREESIFLDPVYTGKAAAGLIDLVRSGELGAGKRVLFLHTGGAPSLFHYQTRAPSPARAPEATTAREVRAATVTAAAAVAARHATDATALRLALGLGAGAPK
ncbi:hypothetical protein KFE25_002827 [Diacronema lutheri]|uniref:Tryptophan synthase beta chain-like PALP domain-containing protein n=2 Tax=Diacronema lutheri TaxID=2081491 RepID=A0A8J5XU75_DIALT|nr:hypothetical protein KFE25_002827 [Diacronema lutheri]